MASKLQVSEWERTISEMLKKVSLVIAAIIGGLKAEQVARLVEINDVSNKSLAANDSPLINNAISECNKGNVSIQSTP